MFDHVGDRLSLNRFSLFAVAVRFAVTVVLAVATPVRTFGRACGSNVNGDTIPSRTYST